MIIDDALPLDVSLTMMRECLCMRIQMASRAVGRRFDEELRPLGINNWQLTLMMALSLQAPPSINGLADLLGMVRTNLTKNLKPLERRGLLVVSADRSDARVRRVALTPAGRHLLALAIPYWRAANAAISAKLSAERLVVLRSSLATLADIRL